MLPHLITPSLWMSIILQMYFCYQTGKFVNANPQRDHALDEAINYLCKTADKLRASFAGDLNLAVTWSVAARSDVADALIGVAEMGRVDEGTCVCGGCDILALTTYGRGGLHRVHWN